MTSKSAPSAKFNDVQLRMSMKGVAAYRLSKYATHEIICALGADAMDMERIMFMRNQ